MADSNSNNTQATAVNLGTITYDTGETSFNIVEYDSLNRSSDDVDYFTINTDGVDLLKIDIHPIVTGDYQYKFYYNIGSVWASKIMDVTMYGDNGSYDGIYDSFKSDLTEDKEYMMPYTQVNGNENYLVLESTDYSRYIIFDETMFNAELDPHLKVTPSLYDGTVNIYVKLESFSSSEDLSYSINITPLSGTASTIVSAAESHLSSYGVTMEIAKDFIMTNIDNLTLIYNTCKTYGVTNDMISEILADDFDGINGTIVANYFAVNGIDTTDLGGSTPTVTVISTIPSIDAEDSAIDTSGAIDLGIGTPVFIKTSQQYNDNDPTTFSVSYESSTGNIIQTNDQSDTVLSLKFDSEGKETTEIATWSTTSYTYDSQGRISQKIFDFGDDHTIIQTYSYEGTNVTIQAPDSASGFTDVATGEIDSNGNITSLGWAWGHESDTEIDQMEYFTYDSNGNELTQNVDSDLDGTIDYTHSYEWGLFI